MRDIQQVITRIEAELPANDARLDLLKWQIKKIKEDTAYHAPELVAHDWHDLGNALNSELYPFVMNADGSRIENPPEWTQKIRRIITDTESVANQESSK